MIDSDSHHRRRYDDDEEEDNNNNNQHHHHNGNNNTEDNNSNNNNNDSNNNNDNDNHEHSHLQSKKLNRYAPYYPPPSYSSNSPPYPPSSSHQYHHHHYTPPPPKHRGYSRDYYPPPPPPPHDHSHSYNHNLSSSTQPPPSSSDYYTPNVPPSRPPEEVCIINGEVASKVIHFRNVVSSINQQDILSVCTPFGEVYQVVMLSDKNQALVQMAELSSAIQFLQYYSDVPINIRGRKVYARFSRHPELRHNNMVANKVILVTYQSEYPLYQLSIEIIWQLFSYYGIVDKIVMVKKDKGDGKINTRQSLVQFANQVSATAALDALTGESVYIGDPPTRTSIHIQYSNLTSLIVKQQSIESRDFTEVNAKHYSGYYPSPPHAHPSSSSAYPYPGSHGGGY